MQKQQRNPRRFLASPRRPFAAVALAALATIPAAARAATVTWTAGAGGSDASLNTPGNWDAGALPTSADVASFNDSGITAGGTLQAGADLTVGRISFDAGLSKDLTLAGQTITLAGVPNASNVFIGLNRAAGATGVQTIASNLLLTRDLTFTLSGGSGRVVIDGVIGEAAAGVKINKQNPGTLDLNAANTFTGQPTLQAGTVHIGNAAALGNSTTQVLVSAAGASNPVTVLTRPGVTFARNLQVRSGAPAQAATLGGAAPLAGPPASASSAWTGNINLNKDVTLTAGGGSVDFRGVIRDGTNSFASSNVTKSGDGTVTLSGANAYSGTTRLTGGTLLVNGSLSAATAAVTVDPGARLGGIGSISRPVIIASGGILAPGQGGAGTLTIAGDQPLTLADGAVYEWEAGATPATSDQVVASAVEFGSGASIRFLEVPGNAPDPSATYVILSWTGADPASLAGWTIDPTSPYRGALAYVDAADGLPGGQIALTGLAAVPEPSTVPLAAAAAATWLARRPRRRPGP